MLLPSPPPSFDVLMRSSLANTKLMCQANTKLSGKILSSPQKRPNTVGSLASMAEMRTVLSRATSQKDWPAPILRSEPTQRSDSDCNNLGGLDTHRKQGSNINSQRGVVSDSMLVAQDWIARRDLSFGEAQTKRK